MPNYAYVCPHCGFSFTLRRPLPQRAEPADCPQCGQESGRVFSIPNVNAAFQNSDFHYENKYALGFSEGERLETMKADDAAYARKWA